MTSPQVSRSVDKVKTPRRAPRAPEPLLKAQPVLPLPELRPPAEEAIRKRALEIYLERGGDGGDALGDWLQAEREYWFRWGRPEKALWRGPHSPVR